MNGWAGEKQSTVTTDELEISFRGAGQAEGKRARMLCVRVHVCAHAWLYLHVHMCTQALPTPQWSRSPERQAKCSADGWAVTDGREEEGCIWWSRRLNVASSGAADAEVVTREQTRSSVRREGEVSNTAQALWSNSEAWDFTPAPHSGIWIWESTSLGWVRGYSMPISCRLTAWEQGDKTGWSRWQAGSSLTSRICLPDPFSRPSHLWEVVSQQLMPTLSGAWALTWVASQRCGRCWRPAAAAGHQPGSWQTCGYSGQWWSAQSRWAGPRPAHCTSQSSSRSQWRGQLPRESPCDSSSWEGWGRQWGCQRGPQSGWSSSSKSLECLCRLWSQSSRPLLSRGLDRRCRRDLACLGSGAAPPSCIL